MKVDDAKSRNAASRNAKKRSWRFASLRRDSVRLNSIRARMTAGFALFSGSLMLLVCLAFYLATKRADIKNADALLWQAAQEIRQDADSGQDTDGEHSGQTTPDFLNEIRTNRRANGLAIWVLDPSGRVMAHSPSSKSSPLPAWPLRGDSWRAQRISTARYQVVLALSWHKTERELRERTLLLLLLSLLVVAATAGGAWVLVGRTLSPIDALTRQAQSASSDNLGARLQAPSRDEEMVRLVATFNDLLGRWSETARSRERFYAAAAHELRTPLQALGGHLEVALSRSRPALEYENALRESHAQTERLTGLVQDLLLLNQLECETSRPALSEFDLTDLCEGEVRNLRALMQERGLRIEWNLMGNCEIEAPWNHATMLLRNLLENAVKYATPGGTIRISLDEKTLTICNDFVSGDLVFPNNRVLDSSAIAALGDELLGANAANLEKLFEPFYRPDVSRTSSTGGNGLGLAICRAICHANGWTVSLRQSTTSVCATVVFCGQRR